MLLSKSFGWTTDEICGMTFPQVLLYLGEIVQVEEYEQGDSNMSYNEFRHFVAKQRAE